MSGYEGRHANSAEFHRRTFLQAVAVGGVLVTMGAAAELYSSSDSSVADGTEQKEPQSVPLSVPSEADPSREVDLLAQGNWKYMRGAEYMGSDLRVTLTGSALRPEVGTDVFANPADFIRCPDINWYGTHLQTNGKGVAIAGRLTGIEEASMAAMTLAAAPPIKLDEKIYPSPGLEVRVHDHKLVVTISGMGDPAVQEIPLADPRSVDFYVRQTGDQVVVGHSDATVTFNTNPFASTNAVWLGVDGTPGASFHIAELKAYPTQDGEVQLIDTSQVRLGVYDPNNTTSLQAVAARRRSDMLVGTTFADEAIVAYPGLADLVGKQVGMVKPERLGKMQAILPGGPDEKGNIKDEDLVWDDVDAFFDIARRNGKKVVFHTAIFGEALSAPTEYFLKQVAENHIPRDSAKNFITQYVTKLVGYIEKNYSDLIVSYDIGNEILKDTGDDSFDLASGDVYRKNAWYKAVGGAEYVEVACRAARNAGAKKIYLNDNGLETDDDRTTAMIGIAGWLRKKGLVDGVGMQGHIDDGDIDEWRDDNGDLQLNIVTRKMSARYQQYRNAGLEVMVSELSIEGEDPEEQAIVGRGIAQAALRAPNVKALCFWGLATGEFYMTSEPGQNGNDAPWDWQNGRPVARPFAAAVLQGLQS